MYTNYFYTPRETGNGGYGDYEQFKNIIFFTDDRFILNEKFLLNTSKGRKSFICEEIILFSYESLFTSANICICNHVY